MSTNLTRRSGLAVIAFLLLAVGLAGCGGGGYGVYGGTLEVRNDISSFEGIDYVHLWVPGGPVETFGVFLAPGERDFIDLFPDSYTVELEWSDLSVDSFPFVDIYDGDTTLIVGVN